MVRRPLPNEGFVLFLEYVILESGDPVGLMGLLWIVIKLRRVGTR